MDGVNNTGEQQKTATPQTTENSTPSKRYQYVFGEDDEQNLTATPSMRQIEMFGLFSDTERSLLVKKLFADDEATFRSAATEISLLQKWDEVAHYLDTLFFADDIDPFSAEAVLFTDKLFAYFHSSESNK